MLTLDNREIFTKIRACEQLQKFCEHEQASSHVIFASNSTKGQILQALSNWIEPFDTPTMSITVLSLVNESLILTFLCPEGR